LICIPGDTIAAFVIMALILYPILIANGSSNMCNLNINPALTIFIDLVLVMMLFNGAKGIVSGYLENSQKDMAVL